MSSKERVGHHLLLRPFYAVAHLGYLFGLSIWRGGSVVLGSRAGLWLLPGYALALYGHRFIENTLLSVYTRRAIGVAAYAELGIGGSCAFEQREAKLTCRSGRRARQLSRARPRSPGADASALAST